MTEVKIPLVNLKSDDSIIKNWSIDFVSSSSSTNEFL